MRTDHSCTQINNMWAGLVKLSTSANSTCGVHHWAWRMRLPKKLSHCEEKKGKKNPLCLIKPQWDVLVLIHKGNLSSPIPDRFYGETWGCLSAVKAAQGWGKAEWAKCWMKPWCRALMTSDWTQRCTFQQNNDPQRRQDNTGGELLMSQSAQACDIKPKKTWGRNDSQRCFREVLKSLDASVVLAFLPQIQQQNNTDTKQIIDTRVAK